MNLKPFRQARGFSQQKLAQKLGVSRSTVAMWESGASEPNMKMIQRIFEVLSIPISSLFAVRAVKLSEMAENSPKSFVGERIKAARLAAGISQNQLAKRAGVSQAGLSAIESTTKSPNVDTLERIANALHIPLQELLAPACPEREEGCDRRWIPVLGTVQAGIPAESLENILDYEEIDDALASTGEFFALQVRGDSMEPKFSQGAEATIKRLKKRLEGILLIANNPAYEPMFFSNREIQELPVRVIGKVVELRAKF